MDERELKQCVGFQGFPEEDTEQEQQGQIPNELDFLSIAIDRLAENVLILEEKLASVLYPDPVAINESDEETKENEICSLAAAIRHRRNSVNATSNNVQRLIKRLEL